MQLSVIIPMYNAEQYIERCLESIYKQGLSEQDFEVIIINDGSLDNSLEIARRIAKKYSNIVIKSKVNEGQGVARNLGMEMARGEYIYFLDSDDQLVSYTLDKLLDAASSMKADITLSTMKVFNHAGIGIIYSDFAYYGEVVNGEYAILHGLGFSTACARLFSNAFLKKCKLQFRAHIQHEDVLFSMHAAISASKIYSTDICSYLYSWNSESTDRKAINQLSKRSIMSDLEIANEERKIAETTDNIELRRYFVKRCNSLIVSNIYRLILQNRNLLKEYISLAKKYQLVPIKGTTMSCKTTFLSFFINVMVRVY